MFKFPSNRLKRNAFKYCDKLLHSHFSTSKNAIVQKGVESPWRAVKDPNGSSLVYYWNVETNETTALGASKPRHWVEVDDPKGSGLTYWWDPESNETTALGVPRPSDNLPTTTSQSEPPAIFRNASSVNSHPQPMTFGRTMVTYAMLGVGVTLGATFVRVLLGF